MTAENDPLISASELLELANKAEVIGATRYAEAYRLLAGRMLRVRLGCEVDGC